MFLKTIGDAKLLNTNELFVLRDVPDDPCLRMADEMVKYFITDTQNEEKTLITEEHIEWVMQIFGRAFKLPIKSDKSIKVLSGAISLYTKWMHLPTAPQPIQKKALYFTKNRNISANSNEFQVHVSLCQRVLGIYSKSARTPPPTISEIDWNEFLCRIFLGICDEVMRGPADSRSLGNDIEQDVFFCMFDIWLRAQMKNETLWTTLLSMASKEWIHRRWFIESWGQCCCALTRALIHVLYGGDNGSDAVFVFWPVLGTNVISINAMLEGRGSMIAMTKYNKSKSTSSQQSNANYEVKPNRFGSHSNPSTPGTPSMSPSKNGKSTDSPRSNKGPLSMATYIEIDDDRLLIYLWNQMLNLLDIASLNDPECFGCAIAWISRMVDMFLHISIECKQRKNGILRADGNSILDILSHQLFTAAVNMNGFEEARAIALGGLCRIFVNRCDTTFKSEYLLNFYHTLHELLRNPNSIEETARQQVILNGATLFACDFDGARALITIFLPHIGIILRKPQKPRLRLAAITMLCSFISLEFQFINAKIAEPGSKEKGGTQLPKLRERLKLITNIIYDAIQTETNEYNLQKLLWCCSVFLIISSKYISKLSPFPSNLVRTIWKHIEEEAGHWQCQVITTAFKALSHVIEQVVHLDKLRDDTVLNKFMFIEMCQYAKIHLEAGTQFDIDSRRVLSVACMKCVLIWLKCDCSLIMSNVQVSKALRDLIRHAIKLKANRGQIPSTSTSVDHDSSSSHNHHSIPTDYDYSGNEPPPLWDTMTFKSASHENTNALKDVYRATDKLARFFTNDLGSYYGLDSICNSPQHRYAESYLNEQQIEDYIWKSLHGSNQSDKWQSRDRIRYFAYKKNRIFTLIEMPRYDQMNTKHCDVIVLVRDAYGKYAWEASGIYDDVSNKEYKTLDEIIAANPNIIDNDKLFDLNLVTMTNAQKQSNGGNGRQDKISRSLSKAQILSQQKGFHHDDSKDNEENGQNMNKFQELMTKELVTKNVSKSSAAYWSSSYIESNWRYVQEKEALIKTMRKNVSAQDKVESNTQNIYTEYQQHPLKNVNYQRQQAKNKKMSKTLNKKVAFSENINLFSESKAPSVPTQDDAATFMHCRRLLSSLGFLRPNPASGVARHIDLLNAEQISQDLNELDAINGLDRIAVSILYHNDATNQLSDFDILSSPKSIRNLHSESFEYFLCLIANRVPIKRHFGFKHSLTHKDVDSFSYYSDSINGEIAYIVPSELKSNVTIERKKELYLSTCIRIIWSESNEPLWLSPNYVATQRHPSHNTPIIYIRITAQSHGLYRVSIHAETMLLKNNNKRQKSGDYGSERSEKKQILSELCAAHKHTNTTSIPTTGFERVIIGPLVDGMVISEALLPDLVRKTCVNASHLISELMDDSLSIDAKEKRERKILQISAKYEKYRTKNREKYYELFFVNPDSVKKS